ncbi:MAG: hypothetical protein ACYDBB_22590 [Armatimonadota bacterium]
MLQRTCFSLLTVATLLVLGLGLFTGCSDSRSSSGGLSLLPTPDLHSQSPLPVYVAFRDGDGVWQRLQESGNGSYTAPISDPDGRYTVLMVMDRLLLASTRVQESGEVLLVHGTLQETSTLWYGLNDGNPDESPYTVSGSISNAPASLTTSLELRMGRYGMWSGNYTNPSYQLYNPPMPGTHDLIAYTRSHISFEPDTFIAQRNIAMTGNLVYNIDFSTAVAAQYSQLTLSGGEWGNRFAYVNGITANGTEVDVSDFYENQNSIPFALLPEPANGDLYRVNSQVSNDDAWAQLNTWHTSPANSTVPLPEQFTGVTVDNAGAAPAIHGLNYNSLSYGAAKVYVAHLRGVDASDNEHTWKCYVTPGALRGATSLTLPAPDSLPNWDAAWSLPNLERGWRVFAIGGGFSIADLLGLYLNSESLYRIPATDGAAFYSVGRQDASKRSTPLTRNDRRGLQLLGR